MGGTYGRGNQVLANFDKDGVEPARLAVDRDGVVGLVVDLVGLVVRDCGDSAAKRLDQRRAETLRLAVEKSLPVTLFLTGINLVTGKRTLNIKSINPSEDLISLTACVFDELSLAIEKDPAAWHFWSESERFFEHPSA